MPTNVSLTNTDAAILWTGSVGDTDARTPTAEELAATEQILRGHLCDSRKGIRPDGWLERPNLRFVAGQLIASNLKPWVACHPALGDIPQVALTLPGVAGDVDRRDWIYLVAFSIEIGADQDPSIALEISWPEGAVLQTLTKESTRRIRDGWALLGCSGQLDSPVSAEQVATALGGTITISRSISNLIRPGVPQCWLYGLDGSLPEGTYTLTGTVDLLPLCRVWRRVSSLNTTGYTEQSTTLEDSLHLEPAYRYVGDGWDNWPLRVKESLYRLCQGRPLQASPVLRRWVYNLINGQVGANPDAPGLTTISLSGDLIMANGQRTQITNAAYTSTGWVSQQALVNNGSGAARASVTLSANSPSGTIFAGSGHRVWSAAGANVTSEGAFAGSGTAGPLTWTAAGGASVSIGSTVYLAPAIAYPAGAGFPASGTLERVYLNGAPVPENNLQHEPLTAYRAAESPNAYLVVANSATGGITLYKSESLTASATGVVSIPGSGLIAYISGPNAPSGFINAPVVTGLDANGTYTALCIHAPTAGDQWQAQWLLPQYAGQGQVDWLDGATLTTPWIALAHRLGSQAGGGVGMSAHAIALRLPRRADDLPSYQLGTANILESLGLVQEWAVPGGNVPALPGGIVAAIAGLPEPLRLVATVTVDGVPLDVAKPTIGGGAYQLVLACGLRRANGDPAMLVATVNGLDGQMVTVDQMAFDVFNLW